MLDRAPATPNATVHRSDRLVTPVAGRDLQIIRNERVLLDIDEIAFGTAGIVAIMGPNGAGKSMLIKALAGLITPDRGTVTWAGAAPTRKGYARFGLLLQHPVLLRRSAMGNIEYALRHAGHDRTAASRSAARALEHAGLERIAQTSARLLSGGEKQRLAMARALALEPEILFLDEPTASLDPASTLRIEEMIGEASRAGTAVVLVTHDIAQARRLAESVLLLHRGRIVERAMTTDFFDRPRTPEARAFAAGDILV